MQHVKKVLASISHSLKFFICFPDTDTSVTAPPTTTDMPPPDCYLEGIAYSGDPVRGIKGFHIKNVMSAQDCQEECNNDADCYFWTWNSPSVKKKNHNTCWLKAGRGQIRNVYGKVSGPKNCPGKKNKSILAHYTLYIIEIAIVGFKD